MEPINLDDQYHILTGHLPDDLIPDDLIFEQLWQLHPEEFHDITIHGKTVKTPRWQQAYDQTYRYAGSRNEALQTPDLLKPYHKWSCDTVDPRLNGLLLNWYDGQLDHYIGKHRDSTTGLLADSPIVTVSFGEQRTFRMRPWKGKGYTDFPVDHGSVIIIPFDTNQAWTHEVPNSKRLTGRRISLTIRAFG